MSKSTFQMNKMLETPTDSAPGWLKLGMATYIVILATRKPRQEDHRGLKASLGSTVRLGLGNSENLK